MGQSRQLEYQRVLSYAYGDNILAYTDNKNDLKFYDGKNVQTATNMNVEYKVSDTYLVFKVATGLYMIEDGKPRNLSMFAGDYIVKDSLVLFEDTRMNTWNIVYKGMVRQLYQSTVALTSPAYVGDNIVVFKDNGDVYRVFYKGQVYEFGVWMDPIKFSSGGNVACFNDPTMNTFAIFENGEFLDVEPQFAKTYKAGRNFIAYEDVNGNLMYYSKGQKATLSEFPKSYDVNDNMVFFVENMYAYTYYQGEKVLVCNYIPKDYKLKNDIIAFRNIMGGVSAFIDGKIVELTTQQDSEYEISGNSVLVKLFNRSYIVYMKGQSYQMN